MHSSLTGRSRPMAAGRSGAAVRVVEVGGGASRGARVHQARGLSAPRGFHRTAKSGWPPPAPACRTRGGATWLLRATPESNELAATIESERAPPDETPPAALEPVTTMRIIRFVLPTLGIWIMNPVLSLVDTAVVGRHSSLELAAMGPSVMLCDHLGHIFNFLAVATTNLLSLAFAAGNKDQAEQVLSESLMAALLLGGISGAALLAFAPQCMGAMAGSGGADIVPAATVYCRIRAVGHALGVVATVLQSFFLAARNPLTPLLSVAGAGLLNFAGDMLLCGVFGLGIAGAAAATVFAQAAVAAVLLRAARRPQPQRAGSPVSGWQMRLRARIPSPARLLRLVTFAGPVGVVLLIKVGTYLVLNAMASSVGPIGTGAHHIAFSVNIFFSVFGDAVSMAGQAFLPPAIGYVAARPRALGGRLLATGAAVGVGNAVAASAVLLLGAGAFAADPRVVAQVAALVPFVAATMFIHCCSMATEGIMLAGRRYFYLVASLAANCALVAAAFHAALGAGLPQLSAVWVGILTFQSARLLMNMATLASPWSVLRSRMPLRALA
eukprot:jgi/Tetstr1/435807/TSEL_024696.t1